MALAFLADPTRAKEQQTQLAAFEQEEREREGRCRELDRLREAKEQDFQIKSKERLLEIQVQEREHERLFREKVDAEERAAAASKRDFLAAQVGMIEILVELIKPRPSRKRCQRAHPPFFVRTSRLKS